MQKLSPEVRRALEEFQVALDDVVVKLEKAYPIIVDDPINKEIRLMSEALESWRPMIKAWVKGKGASTSQVADTLVATLRELEERDG